MTDDKEPIDRRDGSMGDVNSTTPPPLQADTFRMVLAEWAAVPRIGVHSLILRSLTERGIVETRWHNGVHQWRRA